MRQKMILALVLGGMLSAQAQHVQESKGPARPGEQLLLSFWFSDSAQCQFWRTSPEPFSQRTGHQNTRSYGKTDSLHCWRLCVARSSAARRIRTGHLRDASQRTDFGVWTRDFICKKHTGLHTPISVCAWNVCVRPEIPARTIPGEEGRHHCLER